MSTQLLNLALNAPTNQEWADAYSYLLLDPNFTSNTDHNRAVTDYVVLLGGHDEDDEKDKEAIQKDIKELAKKGAIIKTVQTHLDGFKNTVSGKLSSIGKAKCLSGIANSTAFTDAIKALQSLVQIMSFKVEREITGNYSGTVKISFSIVEETDPEDAVAFALAHEFGHSVNLVLNPYNPNDPKFPDVYNALLPPLPTSTTGSHKLEYFADSFAAVFLVLALGMDRKKIPDATKFLFAAEEEGKDHPSGDLRIAKIRETLEQRC